MGFRLVQTSVTSNDPGRQSLFCAISLNSIA